MTYAVYDHSSASFQESVVGEGIAQPSFETKFMKRWMFAAWYE